ncbi:MAG: potassium transporter TrkG [Acidobacteriota bacterium]|nr:potassium transporter TrkG [Acidobacteriota bacterium]
MSSRRQPGRRDLLLAAQLTGSTALTLLAQQTVDMTGGYFGSAEEITAVGAGLSLGLVALTVLVIFTFGRSRSRPSHNWRGYAVSAAYSLNIGLFVPAMAADPVPAGLVVLWNALLLGAHFLPAEAMSRPRRQLEDSELWRWLMRWYPALRHLTTLTLVLTVAVVGYQASAGWLPRAVCLILGYGSLALAAPFLRLLLQQRRRGALLPLAAVLASLASAASPALMLSLLALALAVLLGLLLGQQESTEDLLKAFYRHPSRLVFASFVSLVLMGTVFLTFPSAAAPGTSISALDALFTATSAVCVTGLIVLDTPNAFSPLGHGVILGLIQVGGLGIMVLSTFATLLLGGSLGLRGERALNDVLELQPGHTAYVLTRFIVLSTLAVEAVGAVILGAGFLLRGETLGDALWLGLFHSISAFCNAGFALQSDSVVIFQQNPWMLLTLALLITAGGLGFVVLAALWQRVFHRRWERVQRIQRFSVQVRVVLAASAALVAAGWLVYALTEWSHSLAGLPTFHKLTNSFFQSVTLRTAGFNSVDFAHLAPATLLLMMILMFIGASPGGTGGGIKTTTLVVLLAAIWANARNRPAVQLAQREISRGTVYRSLAVVLMALAVSLVGFFLLLLAEDQAFDALLFEVVSAAGTVGLSLGATAELGPVGKFIIIAIMFIGRIGPLTLVLSLATGETSAGSRLRYPETSIMVG